MEFDASMPVQTSTIATPYFIGLPSGSPQMLIRPDSACRMKSQPGSRALRPLDLDDVGAHVAEDQRAEGARQDARQSEHADPAKRAILAHGHVLRMEGGALRSLAHPSR